MPTHSEDQFISWWRKQAQFDSAAYTSWLAQGFCMWPAVTHFDGNTLTLTPRGRDLLATADAIGYDPDASQPEPEAAPATRECPDCKGRGRVPISELRGRTRTISELLHDEPAEAFVLPGWDVTCTGCNGARVVPVEYAAGIDFGHTGTVTGSRDPDGYLRIHDEIQIDRTHAKVSDFSRAWLTPRNTSEHYLAPALENARKFAAGQYTQPGEWIDFTCLADVEGWEGATIEVRHRDGDVTPSTHQVTEVEGPSNGLGAFLHTPTAAGFTSGLGWQFRKLASVEKPNTHDLPDSPPGDGQTSKWLHVPAGWSVDELKAAARFGTPRDLLAERWAAEVAAMIAPGHSSILAALALGTISHGEAEVMLKDLT